MSDLRYVHDILEELSASVTMTERLEYAKFCLQSTMWLKKVVIAAYNEDKYHVTNLDYCITEKYSDNKGFDAVNFLIFKHLNYLSAKGSCALEDEDGLAILSSVNEETWKVVNRILNKDLRCGLGKKSWQKLIPELTPKYFEPMLAEKDLSKFIEYAKSWDNIYWSVKLDGVRCITVINNLEDIRMFSRTGKEFFNFNHVKEELSQKLQGRYHTFPITLDGEMMHKDGFQTLMKFVKKKSCPDLSDVVTYHVFDHVENVKTMPNYETRYIVFKNFLSGLRFTKSVLQLTLNNYQHSVEDLRRIAKTMIITGCEGIILRTKDGLYENKRTRQLCKIKALYLKGNKIEVDLRVQINIQGTGKYEDTMGAILCTYNGKDVCVGSGFSDAQRDEFWKNPPKVIEVHADSITEDGSLRFPIFSKVKEW